MKTRAAGSIINIRRGNARKRRQISRGASAMPGLGHMTKTAGKANWDVMGSRSIASHPGTTRHRAQAEPARCPRSPAGGIPGRGRAAGLRTGLARGEMPSAAWVAVGGRGRRGLPASERPGRSPASGGGKRAGAGRSVYYWQRKQAEGRVLAQNQSDHGRAGWRDRSPTGGGSRRLPASEAYAPLTQLKVRVVLRSGEDYFMAQQHQGTKTDPLPTDG